jgi:hypothetical protein
MPPNNAVHNQEQIRGRLCLHRCFDGATMNLLIHRYTQCATNNGGTSVWSYIQSERSEKKNNNKRSDMTFFHYCSREQRQSWNIYCTAVNAMHSVLIQVHPRHIIRYFDSLSTGLWLEINMNYGFILNWKTTGFLIKMPSTHISLYLYKYFERLSSLRISNTYVCCIWIDTYIICYMVHWHELRHTSIYSEFTVTTVDMCCNIFLKCRRYIYCIIYICPTKEYKITPTHFISYSQLHRMSLIDNMLSP